MRGEEKQYKKIELEPTEQNKPKQKDKPRQKKTEEADDEDRRRRSPMKPEEARRSWQVLNKEKKKKGHGFQNFSQKGARSPRKKVKGYSATWRTTKTLAEAAKKRDQAEQIRKEITLKNTLRARKL